MIRITSVLNYHEVFASLFIFSDGAIVCLSICRCKILRGTFVMRFTALRVFIIDGFGGRFGVEEGWMDMGLVRLS